MSGFMIHENPKEDKWYQFKGVKPPERQSHGISEDEIEQHIKKVTDHVCEWRQKGPYIYCTAGQLEHGKNIGVHKRLTGTSNGKPVLIDV